MNIRLVGARLFHVVGQTDRHTEIMKLIVTFRNSADVLKNGTIYTEYISELCRAC